MHPEFTEHWFNERACTTLARLVRQVADVEGRIVEIGSWEGRSTIVIANNAPGRLVHAVDHWQGSAADESLELAKSRNVYLRWLSNVNIATGGNVLAHKMDWRDYHARNDSPVALVFIDAEHTYDEVSAQIAAFRPLMADGGIMCGDDALHPPVSRAVTDAFDTFSIGGVVWWSQIGGQ